MIKAIETEWHGHRFRSRLEAKWAVYFTALCFDWEYEPVGYELDDGTRYLPDFVIHNVYLRSAINYDINRFRKPLNDLYVEVKGDKKSKSIEKCLKFSKDMPIYIVTDIPFAGRGQKHWYDVMQENCEYEPYPFNLSTVDGDGFGGFLGADIYGNAVLFGNDGNYLESAFYEANWSALVAAAYARFEHGENPEDSMGFIFAKSVVSALKSAIEK